MTRGRPETRAKVEEYRRIGAGAFARAGLFAPGAWKGNWQWTSEGRRVATIDVYATRLRVRLDYRQRFGGGEWQDMTSTVQVDWTACGYGGERAWFLCPACGSRCAHVYLAQPGPCCRRCAGLAYRTQAEDRLGRAITRRDKAFRRLGGETPWQALSAKRPAGLHHKTWKRWRAAAWDAEIEADRLLDEALSRLARRLAASR